MTMISFRVDGDEAARAQHWADKLGVRKSDLLRDALHRHLVRLSAEHDVAAWNEQPLTPAEDSINELAEWGPAEDWSDWVDAAR